MKKALQAFTEFDSLHAVLNFTFVVRPRPAASTPTWCGDKLRRPWRSDVRSRCTRWSCCRVSARCSRSTNAC